MTPTRDDLESAARRFLDACSDIETHLRGQFGQESIRGFGELVSHARPKSPVVRQYWNHLEAMRELRNAIAHNSYDEGRPIAAPLPRTVAMAERVRDEIRSPAPIRKHLPSGAIEVAYPEDPLRPHLTRMVTRNFSQIPVYSENGFIGLLTTNAITRWVAGNLDERGDVYIESGSVGAVLDCAEIHEKGVVVKSSTPVASVVEKLTAAQPPLAILVTESGKSSEKPIGIVVLADLPRLLAVLSPSA